MSDKHSAIFGFLSTPSARRATASCNRATYTRFDFYPRPPRGGRRCCICMANSCCIFLSTPSARRATGGSQGVHGCRRISIHALREEGDQLAPPAVVQVGTFLSTPSARRATMIACFSVICPPISIHALREEGDVATSATGTGTFISIHALREEGDKIAISRWLNPAISIHALREEGDASRCCCGDVGPYFYPRPPRGGRPLRTSAARLPANFYPRPPRGGRPACSRPCLM